MSIFTFVLLVSLTLFVRSVPIYPELAYDNSQAIFDVPAEVDDLDRSTTSASSFEDILDTPPPSATTVWFAPEATSSSAPIVAAYYPDWTAADLPPEMVDFDRLDWLDFGRLSSCCPDILYPNSGQLLLFLTRPHLRPSWMVALAICSAVS